MHKRVDVEWSYSQTPPLGPCVARPSSPSGSAGPLASQPGAVRHRPTLLPALPRRCGFVGCRALASRLLKHLHPASAISSTTAWAILMTVQNVAASRSQLAPAAARPARLWATSNCPTWLPARVLLRSARFLTNLASWLCCHFSLDLLCMGFYDVSHDVSYG